MSTADAVVSNRISRHDRRIEKIETELDGEDGFGLRMKVWILWRSQMWIVGVVGTVVGSATTAILMKLFQL